MGPGDGVQKPSEKRRSPPPSSGAGFSRGPSRPRPSPGSELAHLFADLADRLLLELANALARQVVLVADLFQRELVLVVETEAPANDARLDRGEGAEQPLHLFRPFLVRE